MKKHKKANKNATMDKFLKNGPKLAKTSATSRK